MIKKIFNILKKYKSILIPALIIILIGIIVLFIILNSINNSSLKTVDKKSYSFKYDKSWKIKETEEDTITLKHNSNSEIEIQIINLNSEYEYFSIDELIDEILYNIENENAEYKLLSKKTDTITKYQFKGYKMLYENKDNQVMVTTFKKSDKLVIINYKAKIEYFDILLDSVHNIIYNFNLKEDTFSLKNNLKLNTTEINYSKEDSLNKILKDKETYEIASNNYYVKYTIPSNFKLNSLNSTYNNFTFENLDDKDITMNVSIMSVNIYEYLNKDNSLNVYGDYKLYKTNKDYKNFNESLSVLESNYDSYIYINSYEYTKAIKYNDNYEMEEYNRKDENIMLIYALNKNHILTIEISAKGIGITEKLINMIDIESSKNYASYISSDKEDGYILSSLKRFEDYKKENVETINIKIPDKYIEFDKGDNIYKYRYYGLNYDYDMEMYDYEINYTLTSSNVEQQVKNINNTFSTTYGDYNYLTYSSDLTLNGKKFKVYSGGYTNLGGILFTNTNRIRYYINKKVLFYELSNEGYLIIEVSGNGKEISDEILNEVTNFEYKVEKY